MPFLWPGLWVAGGLPVLEVTLRTGVALEAIKRIKDEVDGVYCGAGTVTHGRVVEALEDVGADFAVSPGYTMSLGEALRLSRIPLLPGIATASELMVCLDRGYSCFKFFSSGSQWRCEYAEVIRWTVSRRKCSVRQGVLVLPT